MRPKVGCAGAILRAGRRRTQLRSVALSASEASRTGLRRCARGYADTGHLDEVLCKLNGELVYLWRAVDQDGETPDATARRSLRGSTSRSAGRTKALRRSS
jgi:hypothetical protein